MFETIIIAVLLSLSGINGGLPISNTENSTDVATNNATSNYIKPTLKRNQTIANNIFELEYEFDKSIVDADVFSEDLTFENVIISDKLLAFQFKASIECSKFYINANLTDNTYCSQQIYVYKDVITDRVFTSMDSIDSAWYLAKNYAYNENKYDSNDIIEQYDQFACRDVEQEIEVIADECHSSEELKVISSEGNTKVEDFIYWNDNHNNKHPLKYSRVDLYDSEFGSKYLLEYIGTTYTNENGYYSFIFNNADGIFDFEFGGYDPIIRIYPIGKTFEVAREWVFNDWIFSFYYKCSRIEYNIPTGSITKLNITIPYSCDDNTNKAFSISQAMCEAENFAYKYANMPLNKIHLNVAFPGTVTSFSWNGFSAINRDDWNDWGSIIHEYGHYVENVMGTYGASLREIIINDPSHYISTDHLNDKKDKKYAMELTWSEAWATVFSMIVYDNNSFFCNISYANKIKNYINKYNAFTPSRINSGEGQEESVISYLWDIYDNDDEIGDDIGLGVYEFLYISLQEGTFTLPDFILRFEMYYNENIFNNGKLLENNQIAPEIIPFKTFANPNEPPVINFYPNGSSFNPNNEFDILFFSEDYVTIKSLFNIEVFVKENRAVASYSIKQSEWQNIYPLLKSHDFVYVSLIGYNKTTIESGPYRSNLQKLQIAKTISVAPQMFCFPENYCSTEQEKKVIVNNTTFNTKRLRAGFIENEYINLYPRKKGFGTSYLEFGFNESVKSIDICLSFWSNDERYYPSDKPRASIDYWDESTNERNEALDLLKANLPSNRKKQKCYYIKFTKPATKFRIYSHFNEMTGYTDRNKGRISIGNMDIYFA